jgi:hypothetical protein
MRCAVKYSELFKQLTGLILFPLALTAIYLLVMYVLHFLKVSETMQQIYSIGGSVVLVIIGIFVVRKNVLIDADAEYDMSGVHFQLKNTSFLYKEASISVLFENIQHISFNDNDNYRIYVQLKTRAPKKTIYISPDKYENNATFISYWKDVAKKINH